MENRQADGGSGLYERLALDMLERRKLRLEYFDSQFFGEHGWDILLLLFAHAPGHLLVREVADKLAVSPTTITVMARLLIGQGLVSQGDSDAGWAEIPLTINEPGYQRVWSFIDHARRHGLAA